MKELPPVHLCGLTDLKACALTLAIAFADDDVVFYPLETPDQGGKTRGELWQQHLEMMEHIVRAHIEEGLVFSIGNDYEGVALWAPPGNLIDDMNDNLSQSMQCLTPEGRVRYFEEFLPLLHNTMNKTLGKDVNDAWYLVYIGVLPSARGRGYASRLITYVTDSLDAAGGVPCYLESSNAKNVRNYQRLGFVHRGRVELGPLTAKPVPLDIMVRPNATPPVGQAPAGIQHVRSFGRFALKTNRHSGNYLL